MSALHASPAAEAVDATRGLQRHEPGDVGGVVDDERHDAEHALVEAGPAPETAEPGELVDVVRDEHETGVMDDGAVRVVDLEVERVGARTEQRGQRVRGGLHLRVSR